MFYVDFMWTGFTQCISVRDVNITLLVVVFVKQIKKIFS